VGTASSLGSRFDRSYGYDPTGNVTSIANLTTSQTLSYQYDHRERLTYSGGGGVIDETYSYDSLGNLTQRSSSQGTQAYSYGANGNGTGAGPHQVRSISGVPYSYDANGNLLSRPGRSYAWNGVNQPTSIGGSGMLDETYQYNADGARVQVSTSQATTLFLEGLWDETVGGAIKTYYSLNGTAVAVRETSGSTSTLAYLHGDHLGSVSLVTDGAQGVVSQQEFDAWGKVRSGGVSQTNRNYTGQYLDGSGLLYYNARYTCFGLHKL